jgi:hypothetical protein
MYFSGQDRMDFKVDVSPLVGIDTIVSGLFGNDGKTLQLFRVRGSPESLRSVWNDSSKQA